MSSRDPAKRIPKSIGTDTKLFGAYTLTDVAVALLPGVVIVLAMQIVVPELTVGGTDVSTFTLPLAGVAIGIGALFVYLTPSYTSSLDWLGTFLHYQRQSSQVPHEDAREYTQLERVHSDRNVIERADGAFVGLVHVDPPTMALATTEEWQQKASAFQDFLNTSVEFPIQIFSTTRAFPAEEYLQNYTDRLDDPDVEENPQLAALIENYVDWYAADLDDRQMTIRDHYVVVPVTPAEVQFDHESLAQKLATLPILGVFIQIAFAPRLAEEQEAMADELDERLRRVETGLRDIQGCSTRRVDATEGARLVGEYWAGDTLEYGDMEQALRREPIIGGDPR